MKHVLHVKFYSENHVKLSLLLCKYNQKSTYR